MTSYPLANLGDLAANDKWAITIGPFGSKMKSDLYVPAGIPVVRGANISGGNEISGDWVFVTEDFAKTIPNCITRPGELLFPHRGAIGEVALVKEFHPKMVISSSLMKFRPDRSKTLPEYLFYFFSSSEGRKEILRFSSSVGTPGIGQPLTSLRQFRLPLPDLATQTQIAAVLSALDDKIELNRRMNETLEALAQAIFNDWFVSFSPTRRRQEGATDPVAILGGLIPDPAKAASFAALFPESFGEDGLPEEWTEREIGEQAQALGGSTPSTKEPTFWEPAEHWWATPKDLSSQADLALFETERRISDAGLARITSGLLPVGTVLLSSRAPIGYLAISQVPVAINQGFIALPPNDTFGTAYLYLWCKANIELIVANANGSTFQEISKKNFRPIKSAVPTDERVMTAFAEIVDPLIARIVAAANENRTLAETRDYLLPKLMSGEVRVRDAQNVVSG